MCKQKFLEIMRFGEDNNKAKAIRVLKTLKSHEPNEYLKKELEQLIQFEKEIPYSFEVVPGESLER